MCARLPRTPGVAAAGAALFLLIVGLSGACVPWSDPGLKGAVAVKLSDDNIVIRVKTCGEAPRLGSVELDSARDVHDVLWRIESAFGSSGDSYVLGQTPPGFQQVNGLRTPLSAGVRYYLTAWQLDHALGIPGVVFEPAGLSADRWTVSGGRTLTDAELERLDPC